MDERLCVGNESSPLGDGCSDPAVHPVHPVHPVSISAGPGLLSVCSNGHGILLRPYPAYSGHIQPYLAYGEFFFQKVGGMRKKPSLAFIHRTIISLASGNGRENPVLRPVFVIFCHESVKNLFTTTCFAAFLERLHERHRNA
jgi:hypothetical protein